MGRILTLIMVLLGLLWLGLTLSSRLVGDPFGATTRANIASETAIETTRLETGAAVDVANAEANARMEAAHAAANAQVESARAAAEAQKVQAQERRKSSQTWAHTMPMLLAILAAGGAVWLLIAYRGRLMLVLAERGVFDGRIPPMFPQLSRAAELPYDQDYTSNLTVLTPEEELATYAAQHNQRVIKQNGYYLLVDKQTNQVVKQLAKR